VLQFADRTLNETGRLRVTRDGAARIGHGLACLLAVLLSLPGTWILLGLAVIVELADGTYLPGEEPMTFGWMLLGICTGLAVLGEVIETGAGAAGAKLGGATRRGVIGAIVGGIAGAMAPSCSRR